MRNKKSKWFRWIFVYLIFKLLSWTILGLQPTEIDVPEPYTAIKLENFHSRIENSLEILPGFLSSVNCPNLFHSGNAEFLQTFQKASTWKFDQSSFNLWNHISSNTLDICQTLRDTFQFFTKPLSSEEAEYPLAYGMLVYKDITQLLYVLSAFYQPQNAFCIAIDKKATYTFKKQMEVVQKCFPNIHTFIGPSVDYCGPQIPELVFECVKKLDARNHPWKYYQYLSGFDLPLKTNLEMVRIFKALNGTFNAEVTKVDEDRYIKNSQKSPVPLWKSSLSATFSRESAKAMIRSSKAKELLTYLKTTSCSDESLWATIGGNPEDIPMPGGFSAATFYSLIRSDLSRYKNPSYQRPTPSLSNPFPLRSYYISRYQVWQGIDELGTDERCNGTLIKDSCVFGIGDLPNLVIRPELVAHKFYLHLHPAAFFCWYREIRLRALNPRQKEFSAKEYEKLPQVQLLKGVRFDKLKFFFSLYRLFCSLFKIP